MSVPAPSSQFDFTNEKFLAITCSLCGRGPTYSTTSVNDVDSACEVRASCNPYVDGTQDNDHVYEEIFDKSKLSLEEGIKHPGYQNCIDDGNDKDNGKLVNGVHQRRPVTPSAPFEEDLGLTARKTVPNEYSVFDDPLVKSDDDAKEVNECESNDVDRNIDNCTNESSNDMPQSSESENEQNNEEMDLSSLEDSNGETVMVPITLI
ncbi:hypothetical protein MAR_026365 [Mya arenaria]|uniref:Uncharacterized protein n=1 Tax=Mya arenaria TaxID=6604 RepID=A0ABY7EQC0_MYAAR|nr:hypothetical protein MAR_026365 [Mya arenaria]